MWALSGPAPLGIKQIVGRKEQANLLEFLYMLPESREIVRISSGQHDLQLWFRGLRLLGDFLNRWCSARSWSGSILHVLAPQPQFVAIVPDDMLAVQDLHMAREGMDSESICPICSAKGIQPIVTSSTAQQFGDSRRLIRFFCQSCC